MDEKESYPRIKYLFAVLFLYIGPGLGFLKINNDNTNTNELLVGMFIFLFFQVFFILITKKRIKKIGLSNIYLIGLYTPFVNLLLLPQLILKENLNMVGITKLSPELNKSLNISINNALNNSNSKRVDLSKAVFEVMNIGETLHINDIIKRIIDGLNKKRFYIKPLKDDAENRVGTIISYISDKNGIQQSKIAVCFDQLGNNNYKMISNLLSEGSDFQCDKKVKVSISGNNYIEKMFFSGFFRPKFINIVNINKTPLGRISIIFYFILYIIFIIILPLEIPISTSGDKSHLWLFIFQLVLFYIFVTLILPFIYKTFLKFFVYINKG